MYRSVDLGRLAPDAIKMVDWIDYKFGELAGGWPRYPVAHFLANGQPVRSLGTAPIHVQKFNQPIELVQELGLTKWNPDEGCQGPVLVWFNFNDSLGGELLAARIVLAFQKRRDIELILAVDNRLRNILSANFPGSKVIGKSDNIRPFAGKFQHFLMARDTLRHVVQSERDFAETSSTIFHLPKTTRPQQHSKRRQLAIAWKTTNRSQGRYRNLNLRKFVNFLKTFDYYYASAQHAVTRTERAFLKNQLGDRISFEAIDPSADIDVLAAQIASMDGVITIDNSVLHIAGAFGVPTLALLSVPSYWAWPMSGPNSRWYDSVTLIHQERPGDWEKVLEDTATILSQWDGGNFI